MAKLTFFAVIFDKQFFRYLIKLTAECEVSLLNLNYFALICYYQND